MPRKRQPPAKRAGVYKVGRETSRPLNTPEAFDQLARIIANASPGKLGPIDDVEAWAWGVLETAAGRPLERGMHVYMTPAKFGIPETGLPEAARTLVQKIDLLRKIVANGDSESAARQAFFLGMSFEAFCGLEFSGTLAADIARERSNKAGRARGGQQRASRVVHRDRQVQQQIEKALGAGLDYGRALRKVYRDWDRLLPGWERLSLGSMRNRFPKKSFTDLSTRDAK